MNIIPADFKTPSPADLIARSATLVDDIAGRAAACETGRRVPEETVEQFRQLELHKALMPKRYGGFEGSFSSMVGTCLNFGKVCAPSAWVCGLYMAHGWLGGLFPEQCQDDLWGEDPDALISGSYAPIGKVVPVSGGYRLSGRFPFSSGVPGADWNLCSAMIPKADGKLLPCFTLVPKSDYTIDWDSWKVVGMAGTGSYDVIVDDAFVPEHRLLSFPDAVGSTCPGADLYDNPLYRVSLLTNVPFTLATPSVAAAMGAVERFIQDNRMRSTHGAVVLGGKKVAEFQTVQKRVGEALARVDACQTLAFRDVGEAEAEVRRDGKQSLDLRMRNRRTQSFIAHEAQTAMNLIFDAVGGRALQYDHPIQRAWRDVAAINHHISMNFDAVMSMYGQHRFGLPLEGQY
ncbi:MAG: acyl-CoA dehydrogenase family protein [Beijerinckiaceae bacterium]|nr:acyl-CoA dehydrogenase family protein [Beijerinckiaceae bacterium]